MPDLIGAEVETLAEAVHDAWLAAKRDLGVTSRRSETGEELMVAYGDLSEAAKELDRATVRGVLNAVAEASVNRVVDETCECTPDGRCEHNGSPAAPRVVDVGTLATDEDVAIAEQMLPAAVDLDGFDPAMVFDDSTGKWGDGSSSDEDIYLITARAHADKDLEIIGVPTTAALLDAAVRRRAADPRHRAVVDAARAPLLRRIETVEHVARGNKEHVRWLSEEHDKLAQDFDDLKRQHEEIVPPTARAAGKRKDVATDG